VQVYFRSTGVLSEYRRTFGVQVYFRSTDVLSEYRRTFRVQVYFPSTDVLSKYRRSSVVQVYFRSTSVLSEYRCTLSVFWISISSFMLCLYFIEVSFVRYRNIQICYWEYSVLKLEVTVPLKPSNLITKLHGVMSKKILILTVWKFIIWTGLAKHCILLEVPRQRMPLLSLSICKYKLPLFHSSHLYVYISVYIVQSWQKLCILFSFAQPLLLYVVIFLPYWRAGKQHFVFLCVWLFPPFCF
jgi:hypothetical protein